MSRLGELGEREIIRRLARGLPSRPDVVAGVGDDAAVVRPADAADDWLLTSDAVVEGAHFLADTPPEAIGYKAVGRALSDLAAMGGAPRWALLDVVAAPDTQMARLEGVYRGASALAARYGLALVGGDTTAGAGLQLHVFAVGCVPRGTAVTRTGARAGETLWVTGALGGSLRGRHLAFEPRLAEGAWLRQGGWATAMIDVSDGLAVDLRHLLECGGLAAELRADRIPVADAARGGDADDALRHALGDGEDFELLFSTPAARDAALRAAWGKAFALPLTAIGRITAGNGEVWLEDAAGRRAPLAQDGFEHFTRPARR